MDNFPSITPIFTVFSASFSLVSHANISHVIYSYQFHILGRMLMLYAFFLEHSNGDFTDIDTSFNSDIHRIHMEDIVQYRVLFHRIGTLRLVSDIPTIVHIVRRGHHGMIHPNPRHIKYYMSVYQHTVTTSAPIMVSYPHAVVQHKKTSTVSTLSSKDFLTEQRNPLPQMAYLLTSRTPF